MNSLIIAPQWIGDAVMTEPLLRHLAARGEHLTVLAVPWVAPIYRAMSHITRLQTTVDAPLQHGGLQWRARRELATRIKQKEWGSFERAYVLPNSLKSALVPWLAGIPQRIGYLGEQRYGLLTQRLANPPRHARGSMVAHYLALATCGQGASASSESLQTTPTLAADAQTLKPRLHLPHITATQQTVIVPGAEYGGAKRWPASHFARLIAQVPGEVLVLGSSKEVALCQSICTMAQQLDPTVQVRNLAGQTSLGQAIEIIAAAKAVISNDSGLMHVAAALGIAQVAIFGSSDPRHTPPLNPKARVLWLKQIQGLDCAPCFLRECPLPGAAHLRCLQALAPEQALQALHEVTLR